MIVFKLHPILKNVVAPVLKEPGLFISTKAFFKKFPDFRYLGRSIAQGRMLSSASDPLDDNIQHSK